MAVSPTMICKSDFGYATHNRAKPFSFRSSFKPIASSCSTDPSITIEAQLVHTPEQQLLGLSLIHI